MPEGDDVKGLPCDSVINEVPDAGEVQAAHINVSAVLYLRADPGVPSQDPEGTLEVQPNRAWCQQAGLNPTIQPPSRSAARRAA